MTMKEYEVVLEKVKQQWPKMEEWVKYWTRERMKQLLKEIDHE